MSSGLHASVFVHFPVASGVLHRRENALGSSRVCQLFFVAEWYSIVCKIQFIFSSKSLMVCFLYFGLLFLQG